VKQYRKRPVVVEAVQFTGDNRSEIIQWILDNEGTARWHGGEEYDDGNERIYIDTLEGTMILCLWSWAIRGVEGEFYPCADSIFKATYEEN
jgi:hypothetical protein